MDTVEILKDLIEIDTRNPPGNTEGAVEYLQNLFSSYSTRIYGKDGKLNIVVEVSKGDPEFLFTSHLDTVPSDDSLLKPVVEDGRVYGRGSCDAKGCVASIISAFLGHEPESGVKLAFTADEEIGGKLGLGEVMKHEEPDFVIVGEPFGSDRIGIAQAAVVALKIVVHGESGHTAMADVKKGAVYRASEIITETVDRFEKIRGNREKFFDEISRIGLEVEFRGSGDAVFNPSVVRAGIKRNVVPDRCEIDADIRVAPWIDVSRLRDEFQYEGTDFFVTGFLRPFGYMLDGVNPDLDRQLVNMISSAIRQEGMVPRAVVTLGVGDIRHVRNRGIPAFYLGPRGENLHSDGEFVYIDELYTASRIYRNIANPSGK
ncbi:M20 family metallopeptidase [Geoglobus acetivorans]|uniref:Acetylornithine deacetylase n=1 Tax=Geoglobus acetivorans TaxID=565033 RepID=A0A0A7GDL2_GEOAI|nr:Acetylornithine deacetylase [Geoglobus acetivorans]